ncbi:sugar transferase [Maribacter sp. HTCC2170]|uniref:sugar transferase n=1 Tax=Maribacter sp. (strain HTCC2170 / KCCM 42371) TaxID=313603 RepID=UPI00006B4961|nr:sugar transferase [Maribacter sp. HTCC2170]EAR01083.1 putative undecaprenyl-phosphate glycosyl-1-phosphate transferase [Maribacter sp. HTCC2170]
MYKSIIKRLIDFIASFLGLLVLSPIILIITVILSFSNKGKPFFYQRRPGKNEKIFTIIKFKTMNDKTDAKGKLLPDKDRITRTGDFIRRTSLDEIPQLFSVLKGDMSLIGPRPLLVQYLKHYNHEQKQRHLIRPGITGWAQVNGRNTITWKQKFEYDIWYVQNISFLLDCKILWLTFLKVIKSDDILTPGQAGTEAFEGND